MNVEHQPSEASARRKHFEREPDATPREQDPLTCCQ